MKRILLNFIVIAFSTGSAFAQSANDARSFLVDNWKDSISEWQISLAIATCNRFEFRSIKKGFEDVTSFDPRDGHLSWRLDYDNHVNFQCFSGECAVSWGNKRNGSVPVKSLVAPKRLQSAFDVFQQSCGGPKKSAF